MDCIEIEINRRQNKIFMSNTAREQCHIKDYLKIALGTSSHQFFFKKRTETGA